MRVKSGMIAIAWEQSKPEQGRPCGCSCPATLRVSTHLYTPTSMYSSSSIPARFLFVFVLIFFSLYVALFIPPSPPFLLLIVVFLCFFFVSSSPFSSFLLVISPLSPPLLLRLVFPVFGPWVFRLLRLCLFGFSFRVCATAVCYGISVFFVSISATTKDPSYSLVGRQACINCFALFLLFFGGGRSVAFFTSFFISCFMFSLFVLPRNVPGLWLRAKR